MRNQELVGAIDPAAAERARRTLHPLESYDRVAAVFEAIGYGTRVAIAHALLDQELCTADLALVLGISRPAASQHLRVLRDLRIVRSRRQGRLVLYRLDDLHVAELLRAAIAHEAEEHPPTG